MRGRVMKAGLGLKRRTRVYISLRNKTVWYRDLRDEAMASQFLAKIQACTATLPLKYWHKAA